MILLVVGMIIEMLRLVLKKKGNTDTDDNGEHAKHETTTMKPMMGMMRLRSQMIMAMLRISMAMASMAAVTIIGMTIIDTTTRRDVTLHPVMRTDGKRDKVDKHGW